LDTTRIIAMTIWGNRISPVFDSSKNLMIVTTHKGVILERKVERFNPQIEDQMTLKLDRFNVDTLICGAISQDQCEIITAMGIKLFPFIAGSTGEVLDSYIQQPRHLQDYLMPGTLSELPLTGDRLRPTEQPEKK
jgi:predicted Fe-Mo cluster-binding NifX family protein